MAKEEEKDASDDEDDEDETTEEETDDSDAEEGARLKPIFIRKKDRLTVQERDREEAKQRQIEREAQILGTLHLNNLNRKTCRVYFCQFWMSLDFQLFEITFLKRRKKIDCIFL